MTTKQIDVIKYDKQYFDVYSTVQGAHRKAEYALGLAALKPGMKVLDVGTGHGNLAIETAKLDCQTDAVDISLDSIQLAKDKLSKITDENIQKRISFKQMDARHLDYPDSFFDCVFMLDLMEHLCPDDLEAAFKEIIRVSRNNTQIIIHTSPTSIYMTPIYFILRKILRRKEFRGDEFDVNLQSYSSFSKNLNYFSGTKEISLEKRDKFFSRSVVKKEKTPGILKKTATVLDFIMDSQFMKFISKARFIEQLLTTDLWAKIILVKNGQ